MAAGGFQVSERIKNLAGQVVADRMQPLAFIYVLLFAFGLVGTNLTPKESKFAQAFIAIAFALALSVFLLSIWVKKNSEHLLRRRSLYVCILLMSMIWGGLCAYVQYSLPLGWTSFIVILLALFISSSQLIALVPDYRLLLGFEGLLLLPSAIVNFYNIGGTQGWMIGSFFLAFFSVFIALGWIQHRQYWKSIENYERLDAVVEAMPGLLAWITGEGKFVRVNQSLANLTSKSRKELEGSSISILSDSLKGFLEKSLSVKTKRVGELLEMGKRKFYFVGEKYNEDRDAVVLGIDMTDQHLVQEQLEFQRAQSQSSARYACLGEVMASVSKNIPAQDRRAEMIWSISQKIADGESISEEANLSSLVEEVHEFFLQKAQGLGIQLEKKVHQSIIIKACREDLLLALFNLVNNSIEALENAEDKRIEVSLDILNSKPTLEVKDWGSGIPDYLEDVIFEPNYTTRDAEKSTGLGLSLTKQLVDLNGGSVSLLQTSQPTTFRLEFSEKTIV